MILKIKVDYFKVCGDDVKVEVFMEEALFTADPGRSTILAGFWSGRAEARIIGFWCENACRTPPNDHG